MDGKPRLSHVSISLALISLSRKRWFARLVHSSWKAGYNILKSLMNVLHRFIFILISIAEHNFWDFLIVDISSKRILHVAACSYSITGEPIPCSHLGQDLLQGLLFSFGELRDLVVIVSLWMMHVSVLLRTCHIWRGNCLWTALRKTPNFGQCHFVQLDDCFWSTKHTLFMMCKKKSLKKARKTHRIREWNQKQWDGVGEGHLSGHLHGLGGILEKLGLFSCWSRQVQQLSSSRQTTIWISMPVVMGKGINPLGRATLNTVIQVLAGHNYLTYYCSKVDW